MTTDSVYFGPLSAFSRDKSKPTLRCLGSEYVRRDPHRRRPFLRFGRWSLHGPQLGGSSGSSVSVPCHGFSRTAVAGFTGEATAAAQTAATGQTHTRPFTNNQVLFIYSSFHFILLIICRVFCTYCIYYLVIIILCFSQTLWLYFLPAIIFFWNRKLNSKPNFTRRPPPPLQQLQATSTTQCLPTPHLLQVFSSTLQTSSRRRPKPHPCSWPLPWHRPTRPSPPPSAQNWLIFFPAPWWTLAPSTWRRTRTLRRTNR